MAEQWLTYAELGERIGITPEAARCRASRLRLRRQIGNDGKARVAVDLDEISLNPPKTSADRPVTDRAPDRSPADDQAVTSSLAEKDTAQVTEAFREQVALLKEQLTRADAAAEQRRIEAEREREHMAELTADLRKLAERMAEAERTAAQAEQARTEMEKAKAELAAFHAQERERADRLAGEVADLARQLAKVAEEAGARERDFQMRLTEHMAEAERAGAEAERNRAEAEKQAGIAEATAAKVEAAEVKLAAAQEQHLVEFNAMRDQMQAALKRAEQERDRLAGEVSRWVGLPWWRRLFA